MQVGDKVRFVRSRDGSSWAPPDGTVGTIIEKCNAEFDWVVDWGVPIFLNYTQDACYSDELEPSE